MNYSSDSYPICRISVQFGTDGAPLGFLQCDDVIDGAQLLGTRNTTSDLYLESRPFVT